MLSVFLILLLLIPLAAVVLDSKVGQALARRIEGGAPDSARMRALESEVERLSTELEQVREESQFVARLLEERTSGQGRQPDREDPEPGPEGG